MKNSKKKSKKKDILLSSLIFCSVLRQIAGKYLQHNFEDVQIEMYECVIFEDAQRTIKKPNEDIPTKTQWNITMKYMQQFLYATLYENNNQNELNKITQMLNGDKNDGIMEDVQIGC